MPITYTDDGQDPAASFAAAQEGDLIIVSGSTVGYNLPVPLTAGYNELFSSGQFTGSGNGTLKVRLFWKFKTAFDTSLVLPDITAQSNGGRWYRVYARGVDKTNPFDLAPDSSSHIITGGGGSNYNFPAMTPVTPGTSVLGFAYCYSSSGYPSDLTWNSPFTNLHINDYPSTWYTGNYNYGASKHFIRAGYAPPWVSGAVDTGLSGGYKDRWIVLGIALREAGVSAGGRVKYWNGATFDKKPVKVWDGGAWVEKPVKFWDGTTWKTTT